MSNSFLYIRTLRHADHTVFCVQEGQKQYFSRQFSTFVPFSSGQQVKRSVLDLFCDELAIVQAPITFNFVVEKGKKGDQQQLGNGEPWSPCDPSYPDQLIGGWMRAKAGESITLKRRSPLSISAMRPIHPLLAGINKENATFDRSSRPEQHPVRVTFNGHEMSEDEIEEFLDDNKRVLSRRTWIPDLTRADGLFVQDVAIDKRTLFSVSMNQHEPEVDKETIEKLKEGGWIESINVFGKSLVAPVDMRERIIRALAHSLVTWRVTSNQARTFSTMEVLALAVSEEASAITNAIRARLVEDSEKPRAEPVIDETADANLFVAPVCEGYVRGVNGTANALKAAEQAIVENLKAFDYERQVVPVTAVPVAAA